MVYHLNYNKDTLFTIELTLEEALHLYNLLKSQTSHENALFYSISKKLEYIIYSSCTVEELELSLENFTTKLKDVHDHEKKSNY